VEARGALHLPVQRVDAKLRYRSEALPAVVRAAPGGFSLELEQPAYGVAPGQIAVLYEEGVVVGCGVVSSATRN
jgi:tRNA-specific 2-thiouridylase